MSGRNSKQNRKLRTKLFDKWFETTNIDPIHRDTTFSAFTAGWHERGNQPPKPIRMFPTMPDWMRK